LITAILENLYFTL